MRPSVALGSCSRPAVETEGIGLGMLPRRAQLFVRKCGRVETIDLTPIVGAKALIDRREALTARLVVPLGRPAREAS
jgi:hypothetical protein